MLSRWQSSCRKQLVTGSPVGFGAATSNATQRNAALILSLALYAGAHLKWAKFDFEPFRWPIFHPRRRKTKTAHSILSTLGQKIA